LGTAAHQRATRLWWQEFQSGFEIYISRAVLREVRAGDPEAARSRLAAVEQFPRLVLTSECYGLARSLLQELGLPRKAVYDALHLAVAAVHEMDYLVTWNCRHMANEVLIPKIGSIMRSWGYEVPMICTPEQLLRGEP
jgi:predicted nucleic acid-binding protein